MYGCSTPRCPPGEATELLCYSVALPGGQRGYCTHQVKSTIYHGSDLFTLKFYINLSKQNIIFKTKMCSFWYNKLFIDNNFLHLYFSTFCLITSMVHIHSYVHGCSSHSILTVLLSLVCFLNEVLLSHDALQRRQDGYKVRETTHNCDTLRVTVKSGFGG